MLRLVFMGSDAIALPLLDWLAPSPSEPAGPDGLPAQVVAVWTQPDRPAGRGQKVQPNAIKLWAQARGLPVHQPERLGPGDLARLRELAPDVALVLAYGHILRDDFISVPRLGTLNLHASLLPRYRGASPIQTAIAAGDRATGVSLMRIVRELDAGPVADAERVDIAAQDTAAEVERKLGRAGVPLLARTLPRLAAGTLDFTPQDPAAATYCRRLEKADGVLDFAAPAAALAARINGLMPWPGCTVTIQGQLIKLGRADCLPPETCNLIGDKFPEAGAVIGRKDDGLLVRTGAGVLQLLQLQRPGGRMLSAGEFLRGFPVPAGTVLPSQPMPPLVTGKPFPRMKG